MSSYDDRTISPARPFGRVRVPASKSHSVRALLFAAFATGPSTIGNLLASGDTESCRRAISALGARIGDAPDGTTHIHPIPPSASRSPVTIDVGNSGTTLYLLTALAAHLDRPVTFDGDASLRQRNAGPLLAVLRDLGARIPQLAGFGGTPRDAHLTAPYTIEGPLRPGGRVAVYSPTSQYLSALLLTAPLIVSSPSPTPSAPSTTFAIELLHERPYIEMTLNWLDRLGIRYTRDGYDRFTVAPDQHYPGFEVTLPGDWSSATFWFCAAAAGGGRVTVEGLDPADVQGDRAVLDILARLGAEVAWGRGAEGVTVSGPLRFGGRFDLNPIPDALPALAVAAAFAPEPVHLTNVPQAREKETDRIAVMAGELGRLGVTAVEHPDGLSVMPGRPRGGSVDSHGDHRIAMAFAVAALGAAGPVRIRNAACAAITYPSFFQHLAALAPAALNADTAT